MIQNWRSCSVRRPYVFDGPLQHDLACAVAAALSFLLATMLTVVMMHNHVVVRKTAQASVDSIRCIPFLMLAYLHILLLADRRRSPFPLDCRLADARRLQHSLFR